MNKFLVSFFTLVLLSSLFVNAQTVGRERIKLDEGWRFAFGHPYDTKKDFNNGTSYFSYLTKAGYGEGAAAASYDDRHWRILNLPHDWAVEQPFSEKGSLSHGFKAIGRNFPEASVGWYRKTFTLPETDLGRQISIAFDGVFRNAIVWVNGHYLGTNASGYLGFEYNITEYLNYGGTNSIAVRVDATMEEGWFYEGAGIYRHVWLNKTNPLHVATNGTFVTSLVKENSASITARVSVINEGKQAKRVGVSQKVLDAGGKEIAVSTLKGITLEPFKPVEISDIIPVETPVLWSLENPYLYSLVTTIVEGGEPIDTYHTSFGIRTIGFDAKEGFFLNGKHIKLKGTNNHQDHAGVGAAIPDALQEYRIKALKAFGSNAYRCAHNPPTPELLDVCDRLGMLVIDENRLMGVTSTHYTDVKRLIERDRNHPSIISWSIGNEEWNIEGNIFGARIASTLQAYAKSLDTTRAITAAVSGGWRQGISNVIDVMGYNYIGQIDTDEHHAKFPSQPSWGTEEGSTRATRGVYVDDDKNQWIAAYDKSPIPIFKSIEDGWKHYAARPYLAGMFIWTGFDYRGEPTPFGWPSIGTYFGMLDQCGFPKDNFYFLKSWWTDEPTLHLLPHWNWEGKEGQEIDVWAYSNCDEVELFLNKKSLGKKVMPKNSHLEWKVKYKPGILEAIGYKAGKRILTDKVQTTGAAARLNIEASKEAIQAGGSDICLLTIDVKDSQNLHIPTANNEVVFSISGPGKIIGVGNGDPASLEADKYLETITVLPIENLREKQASGFRHFDGAAIENIQDWQPAFKDDRDEDFGKRVTALVYRGSFNMPTVEAGSKVTLFYKSIGRAQSIYVNGKLLADSILQDINGNSFELDQKLLRQGQNTIDIVATPLLKKYSWETVNMDPGVIQIFTPAADYRRKLFSGLAQVIVQSTGGPGTIKLTASAAGVLPASVSIEAR